MHPRGSRRLWVAGGVFCGGAALRRRWPLGRLCRTGDADAGALRRPGRRLRRPGRRRGLLSGGWRLRKRDLFSGAGCWRAAAGGAFGGWLFVFGRGPKRWGLVGPWGVGGVGLGPAAALGVERVSKSTIRILETRSGQARRRCAAGSAAPFGLRILGWREMRLRNRRNRCGAALQCLTLEVGCGPCRKSRCGAVAVRLKACWP